MKLEKDKLNNKLNNSAIDDSPQGIADVSMVSSKEKRSESSGSTGERRKSIKDSILGVFKRRGSDASSPPTSPAIGMIHEGHEGEQFDVKQPTSIYDRRHRKSNPSHTEVFETRAYLADLETRRKSRSGGPNIVFDPETGKNISTKEVISREEAKTRAMSHLPEAVQRSLLKKKSELINPWDTSNQNQKSPTIPSSGPTMESDGIASGGINEIDKGNNKGYDILPVVTPDGAARVAREFATVSDGERSGARYYDDNHPRSHRTGDVAFSLIGPPGDFNADSDKSAGSGSGKRRSLGDLLFRRRSSAGSFSSDEGKESSTIGGNFDSVAHNPAVILPRSVKAQEDALEHGKLQYPGGPKAGQETSGDLALNNLVGDANRKVGNEQDHPETIASGLRDKTKVSTLGSEYTHNPAKPHVGLELPKVELKKLFKAKTGTHTFTTADPSFEDPAYELKAGGLSGGDSNLQNPEY